MGFLTLSRLWDSKVLSRFRGTTDGVLDWILGLLTIYTHNSELQAITAPSPISTRYKSLQYALGPFQSSVFTSPSLVTASNSWDSSASALKSSLNGGSLPTASFLHRLPYRTDLVAPFVILITPRQGPHRQHRSFSYPLPRNVCTEPFFSSGRPFLLRICCLVTDVPLAVSEPSPSNGCFSGSAVLALSKCATIWSWVLRDWEPRMTVMARASINLPDRRIDRSSLVFVWRDWGKLRKISSG
jgi:hypothetical protein